MVAIISGNELGLQTGSLAGLGRAGSFGNASVGQAKEQVYLNAASGNLVVRDRDEYMATRGVAIDSTRTYNSLGRFNDDNGDNWSNGFYRQPIELQGTASTAGSMILRTARDGAQQRFTFDNASMSYVSAEGEGAFDRIVIDAATLQYLFTDGDSLATERYDASGRQLLRSEDVHGYGVTYSYSDDVLTQARSDAGETTTYQYENKLLVRISTETRLDSVNLKRQTVNYGYDVQDRLSSVQVDLTPDDVTDADSYTTFYAYDGTSHRLASLHQEDGTELRFTYVQAGDSWRVSSFTDGLNNRTTIAYDVVAKRTTVTDAAGGKTVFDYDSKGQLLALSAPGLESSFAYDGQGNVKSITDSRGNSVSMLYNSRGQLTYQADALGNVTERGYSTGFGRLEFERSYRLADPDGIKLAGEPMERRYLYSGDRPELLRFEVSAERRVVEHRYDATGQRSATVRYAQKLPGDTPLSLAALEKWVGQLDATSAREEQAFRYDLRGNVAFTWIGDEKLRTQFVYDAGGRLLRTVAPGNNTTDYTYDGLGRVRTQTDALGHVTLTTYDDANGRVVVKLANGLSEISILDKAGQRVKLQSSDAERVLGTTRYAYDDAGHLWLTKDPSGAKRWTLHDDLGRRVAEVDATGTLVEHRYDDDGRLTGTTAYATALDIGKLVMPTGQPASSLLATLRPANASGDAIEHKLYDAAGRLEYTIDAAGCVTRLRYDGASRLVETRRFAIAYDNGKMPGEHEHDRITRSFHDDDDLLLGTLDAEGHLERFVYDGAGRVTTTISYATAPDPALRAGGTFSELVKAANQSGDIFSRTLYNSLGQVAATRDAIGALTTYLYDSAGRLQLTTRHAKVVEWTGDGDTAESLKPAPDPDDQITKRRYDLLGRLIVLIDEQGTTTRYGYDVAGRLISTERAAGTADSSTQRTEFDLQGRVVRELGPSGGALITPDMTARQLAAIWKQYAVQHAYDAAGRRVSTTDALGRCTLFFYDGASRLTHSVNALGEVEKRGYDAQGRLASTVRYTQRIETKELSGGIDTDLLETRLALLKDTPVDTGYAYDAAGRIKSSTDALGYQTRYAYSVFGDLKSQVTTLQPGSTRTDKFAYDRLGHRTRTTLDAGGSEATSIVDYDIFGRVARETDALGSWIDRSYDARGRVVLLSNSLNESQRTRYDVFDRVVSQRDALQKTTTYAYSDEGRTVTMTTPEGIAVVTEHNRLGFTTRVTDGNKAVTTYDYDADGRLTMVNRPGSGGITRNSYDIDGQMFESIDGAGTRTSFDYDAAGRLLTRIVDPRDAGNPDGLNLRTRYEIDALGRQWRVTDEAGTVTEFSFDAAGRVKKRSVDPEGLNLRTWFSYDAAGHVLSMTDAEKTRTDYEFDVLGRRVLEVVDPDGLAIKTRSQYDLSGQLIRRTDAEGAVTRYTYDAAHRLTASVDALGYATRNTYDSRGLLVRIERCTGALSAAALTGADKSSGLAVLIAAQPPASWIAQERRVYDDDARLTYSIDALGAVTRLDYDAAGNVVKRVQFAAFWNGETALSKLDGGGARESRHVYSKGGLLRYSVDAGGAVTELEYDSAGRVLRSIEYATRYTAVATGDNLEAALKALDASGARVTRHVYDAAGRETFTVDAAGSVTSRAFDRAGRMLRSTLYATAYSGKATGAELKEALGKLDVKDARISRHHYDAAGRETYTADAAGNVSSRVFDGLGNLRKLTQHAAPVGAGDKLDVVVVDNKVDRSTWFGYDAAGRLESMTDALKQAERYGYDSMGRRTSFTNKKGDTWTYSYDAAGRLASETTPKVALITISADLDKALAIGDAKSSTQSVITRFEYDAFGNLTARIEASGRTEERITRYGYDRVGRQVRVTYPEVAVYDKNGGDKARLEVLDTPRTKTIYDVFGNAVANIGVNGARSYKTYDDAGRVRYEVDALGFVTLNSYNVFGDTLRVKRFNAAIELSEAALADGAPDTRAVSAALERAGEGGRVLATDYDAAGRAIEVREEAVFVYDAKSGLSDKAAKTTQNHYNAFGEIDRVSQLARSDSERWIRQYHYYDVLGHQVSSIDALGYLTEREFDADGRLTKQTEYSNAVTDDWGLAAPARAPKDRLGRVTEIRYDALGRKSSEVQLKVEVSTRTNGESAVTDLLTRYEYDAVGNLTRTIDAGGGRTYSFYDALGRVRAVVAPGATGTGLVATEFRRDAHGNVVVKTERADGATVSYDKPSDSFDYAVAASVDDRKTKTRYDGAGRALQVENAAGFNIYNSYNAGGALARTWQFVTTDGGKNTSYTEYGYDRLGRTVAILTPSVEGRNDARTKLSYNAFGEIVERRSAAGTDSFDYDDAGRIWRSSTGGAAKIFLYDLLGRVSAELSSAGSAVKGDIDVAAYDSAALAAGDERLRRSENVYDALGRVVERREPERAIVEGGVTVRLAMLSATMKKGEVVDLDWTTLNGLGSGDIKVVMSYVRTLPLAPGATKPAEVPLQETQIFDAYEARKGVSIKLPTYPEGSTVRISNIEVRKRNVEGEWVTVINRPPAGDPAVVMKGGVPVEQLTGKSAIQSKVLNGSKVQLNWASLSAQGKGDVKVEVSYVTAFASNENSDPNQPPWIAMESKVFSAASAETGVVMSWNTSGTTGIISIASIRVYKQNAEGKWELAIEPPTRGLYGTVLDIATPVDTATKSWFRYRKVGGEWSDPLRNLPNFGDALRFDVNGLADANYEYEVWMDHVGEAPSRSSAGRFSTGTAAEFDATSSTLRPVVYQSVDRWGNVLSRSDARASAWTTRYTYNARNQVTSEVRPEVGGVSSTTRTYYDQLGRQVAVEDARGNVNGQIWDDAGNLVSERHADGGRVTHAYNAFGNRVSSVDALGNQALARADKDGVTAEDRKDYLRLAQDHTTLHAYDALGRLLSTQHGSGKGAVTIWGASVEYSSVVSYAQTLNVKTVPRDDAADRFNLVDTFEYDELGHVVLQRLGGYDTNNNGVPDKKSGDFTTYTYDAAGNMMSSTALGVTTSLTYDDAGRKLSQKDANGNTSLWSYDPQGRVATHSNLGKSKTTYVYDNAGQLRTQTSTAGQNLSYRYDAAGQLLSIKDAALDKTSSFAYDLAGNRLREKTVQDKIVVQDNHLAYDALGRLRKASDGDADVDIAYDAVGNRSYVKTHVWVAKATNADVEDKKNTERHFRYDTMNRAVVVDGKDAEGNLGDLGHRLGYDLNGQRVSDEFSGTKVSSSAQLIDQGYGSEARAGKYDIDDPTYTARDGLVNERYRYDAMGRLASVVRDGIQVDLRRYDHAGRVVQAGADGSLGRGYANARDGNEDALGLQQQRSVYDKQGRLSVQSVYDSRAKLQRTADYRRTSSEDKAHGYDAMGNLLGVRQILHREGAKDNVEDTTYQLTPGEGYLQTGAKTKRDGKDGSNTLSYDTNGYLVAVEDDTDDAVSRTIINDANGRALQVTQDGRVLRSLIVNGELIARHGVSMSTLDPRHDSGKVNFDPVADFNFGYRKITGSYPSTVLGNYRVEAGDSLQGIAQTVYGDAKLWWRIASANGLAGDGELRTGQTLSIPSVVAGASNDAASFRPYDAALMVGDLNPNLPQPSQGGCGAAGQIIMIVVAVVVTVYLGPGVASAIIGNIASQGVGMAIGAQEDFSWKQVTIAAVGGAISGGLSQVNPLGITAGQTANAMARAALGNAMSQGVGMAIGMQEHFSWRSVAASTVGAGVGSELSEALGLTTAAGAPVQGLDPVEKFFKSAAVGLAAGMTTAVARGGRVAVQQVAADAFGNALGNGLADAMQPSPESKYLLAGSGAMLGNGRSSVRLGTVDDGSSLGGSSEGYLNGDLEGRAQRGPIMTDAGPIYFYGGGKPEDKTALLRKPTQAGRLAADETAEQVIKRAGQQITKEAPKVAPFIEGAAPLLGKLATGLGLFFHMEDVPTNDWTATGSRFSYNPDDFTLRVTDGDTGTRLAVPGIHNPSQYSDAQYLSYVSYKANGGQLAIEDFASYDPPSMGPVDRASSQKPEWLQQLDAGNAFNKERASAYPYNEVYINKPSGEKGYFRVDSYNDRTGEIVSRKFTQFSEITEGTGLGYVSELTTKYPNGSTIANVPTNVANGLAGETMVGRQILEVPVQSKPIPQAILDAAYRADVLIRDIKGKTY